MGINVDEKEIYLNAAESRAYARMDTDERGAYAAQVTRELHTAYPDLANGLRFEVVNTSNVLLFFVFTY